MIYNLKIISKKYFSYRFVLPYIYDLEILKRRTFWRGPGLLQDNFHKNDNFSLITLI